MSQQSVLQMSQVQEMALKRALALLEGMKCSYAIIDPIGNKHGLLEIKENAAVKRPKKYPHGERSNYVRDFILLMNVSDVVDIPYGKYEPVEVQASATSVAHGMWGAGSVTTTANHSKKAVEIMRIL